MRFKPIFFCVAIAACVTAIGIDRGRTRRELAELRAQIDDIRNARGLETVRERVLTASAAFVAGAHAAPRGDGPQPALPSLPCPEQPRERRVPPARAKPESAVASFAPIRQPLEALFESEAPDPAWAGEARSLAENALAAHLPSGSRITSAECRASVCRIESSHGSARIAHSFIRDALTDLSTRAWTGGLATGLTKEGAATGEATMTTFLMREGADLPPMLEPEAEM
jgi:hypothetical protein